MINGIPARAVELSTEDICFVDNESHDFLIYKMDGQHASVKISGESNIIQLRDLLNDAYPVK